MEKREDGMAEIGKNGDVYKFSVSSLRVSWFEFYRSEKAASYHSSLLSQVGIRGTFSRDFSFCVIFRRCSRLPEKLPLFARYPPFLFLREKTPRKTADNHKTMPSPAVEICTKKIRRSLFHSMWLQERSLFFVFRACFWEALAAHPRALRSILFSLSTARSRNFVS